MGCRGEHELPGIYQSILSPWSHDSWVLGCPTAPPSYAVGFLHHWAPWRSPVCTILPGSSVYAIFAWDAVCAYGQISATKSQG